MMWVFLVLARSDGNFVNITGTETSSVHLEANDDLFFLADQTHIVMILHSINQIIASVNVHDGQSIIQGYIGRESRSFGVYFGGGTGSVTIHATQETNVTYSWTVVNRECTKMFVSEAPTETFTIDSNEKMRNKKGNETIRPHTNVCFWHAAVGQSVVNVDVNLPDESEEDYAFVTAFNEEPPEKVNTSCQIKRPYSGSFFGMLKVGKKTKDIGVDINIANTTEFEPHSEYRASFDPDGGPQFLMDLQHVPTPVPPSPSSESAKKEVAERNPNVIAGILMAVCLICLIIIVACSIYICKKKQKRKEREIEVLIHMSEQEESSQDKPHIPIATQPVPIFENF